MLLLGKKIVEEEIEPADDDEKQDEAETIRSPIKPAGRIHLHLTG